MHVFKAAFLSLILSAQMCEAIKPSLDFYGVSDSDEVQDQAQEQPTTEQQNENLILPHLQDRSLLSETIDNINILFQNLYDKSGTPKTDIYLLLQAVAKTPEEAFDSSEFLGHFREWDIFARRKIFLDDEDAASIAKSRSILTIAKVMKLKHLVEDKFAQNVQKVFSAAKFLIKHLRGDVCKVIRAVVNDMLAVDCEKCKGDVRCQRHFNRWD